MCSQCGHDRTTASHKKQCGKGTVRRSPYRIARSKLVATVDAKHDPIVQLVQLAKRPIAFEALCDAMKLCPSELRVLIKKALDRNAPLHIEHGQIMVAPTPALDEVKDIVINKAKGKRFVVGAISDTHIGSKYCLRGAIRETVEWFYENGARDILHSGDVLEGCYSHARWELSHHGFDAQVADAAKCFPRKNGLRYHFITGNHDYTFEEHIGMRCGIAIQNAMRARGRTDWICYGDRSAYVRLGGAVVNLWHPRGSGAYARSYHLQKRVEGYTAIKPHVVLMGHYHQYGVVYERGVHAIGVPCFQGSGSNFAQSLRGPPSIGGILLSWQLSETNRIHDFSMHPRFFFERDDLFEARDDTVGIEIPAVGRDRRYKHDRQ